MSTYCCPYYAEKARNNKNDFKLHLLHYHSKSFTFVIEMEGIKRQITIKRSLKGYRCPFCVEIFNSTPAVVNHLNQKKCFKSDSTKDAVLVEFNRFNEELLLYEDDSTKVVKRVSLFKTPLQLFFLFNTLVVLLVIAFHVVNCSHIIYINDKKNTDHLNNNEEKENALLMLLSFRKNCLLPSILTTFKDMTSGNSSLLLAYFFGMHLAIFLYFFYWVY